MGAVTAIKSEDFPLLPLETEKDDNQGKYSWKVVKSVTISISEVLLGIAIAILPAVLHDLSLKLDMSYTQLSIAYSMASVGAIFGAILGGVLTKKMDSFLDIVMVIVHLVNAVTLIGIPFSSNVVAQSIEWFLQGMAMTVGFVVNNVVAVRLWPDNVGPAVLLIASFGSLGNIMGPLLAEPFVSQENSANSFSPLVFVPFVILATMFVTNAINLLIQHALGLRCRRCYDSASISDTKEGPSEPKRPSQLLWLIAPGMGIVDFFVRASDYIPAYLIPSIGIEIRLQMAASQSNFLLVIYDICRTISKLMASLLLKHVSVLWCLPICLVMTTVMALILYLWGLNSVPCFFVVTSFMGLFTGPTATLLVVWCNEYVTVDGYAMTVWQIAENVGILGSVLVGGIVFDLYGSLPSLFVNLIAGIIGCITFFILQFLIIMSGRSMRHQHHPLE